MYSVGSNSEHLNTEHIRNPNVLMFWFEMVGYAVNIYGTDHLKTELFKMAALV